MTEMKTEYFTARIGNLIYLAADKGDQNWTFIIWWEEKLTRHFITRKVTSSGSLGRAMMWSIRDE